MEELKEKIKEYLNIIDPTVLYTDLLDFCVDTVIDRVQLYLNTENVPIKLARILAQITDTNLKKLRHDIKNSEEGNNDVEHAISSISDNGQSINFSNEVTKYFSTASDEEIFMGFTNLLARYRRVKVVYPKSNE